MFSVGSVVAQMCEVVKWLESYDLKAESSRYSHYERYIVDFFKTEKMHVGSSDEFESLHKALRECFYIIFVYRVFQLEKSQGFRKRLSKAVSGRDFLDSTRVAESRDYLFELVVAANFSHRGYNICFDKQTDVVAESSGRSVYAECKRVSSIKQFGKNLKKAGKQLDRELSACKEGRYGLIFIDISAITPSQMQYSVFPSPEAGAFAVQQRMDDFVKAEGWQIDAINERFCDVSLGVCLVGLDLVWTEEVKGFFVHRVESIASLGATNEVFSILNVVLNGYHEVYQSVLTS